MTNHAEIDIKTEKFSKRKIPKGFIKNILND